MEHSCQDRGVWRIDLEIPSELWMSSLSKPRVLPQPLNLGFLIFLCEHQNLNMRISQPTKSWQGPCIQCTDVIVSVLAMFPMISPTPSWIFSTIQAHPSPSWRLTEAKQGQESGDHCVTSTQTKISSSVLQLKKGGWGDGSSPTAHFVPRMCEEAFCSDTLVLHTTWHTVSFLQST